MTRSASRISAILASTSLSPSAAAADGLRRAAAFSSVAWSFIAARSSSVNPTDAAAGLAGLRVLLVAAFLLSAMVLSFHDAGDLILMPDGFPAEAVRVGERPGFAADDDPV